MYSVSLSLLTWTSENVTKSPVENPCRESSGHVTTPTLSCVTWVTRLTMGCSPVGSETTNFSPKSQNMCLKINTHISNNNIINYYHWTRIVQNFRRRSNEFHFDERNCRDDTVPPATTSSRRPPETSQQSLRWEFPCVTSEERRCSTRRDAEEKLRRDSFQCRLSSEKTIGEY